MSARSLSVLLLMGFCSACVSQQPPARKPPVREHDAQAAGPATARRDPIPDSLLAAVRADAAQKGGVDPAQLEIVAAEKVTWSDGALGCPQPGRMYTQALVPGYRIWVRAGKVLLDYHANDNGVFSVCPSAVRQIDPNAPVTE